MKTKKLVAMFVIVAMLFSVVATVVACTPEEVEHVHDYSAWGQNDTQHWKYCPTDSEEEADSRESHNYNQDGNTKCICGATKPAEEHQHSYTKWDKDDTQHWKYCPADNAIDESTMADHAYTFESNTKCVCGAFKPLVDDEPDGPIVTAPFNALIITATEDTITSVMIEDDGTVSVMIVQNGAQEPMQIELTYEITSEGIITIKQGDEVVGSGSVVGRTISISIEQYGYEIQRDLYTLSMTVLGEEQVAYCAEGSPLRMMLLAFAEDYDVKIDNVLLEGAELLNYVMPAHSIVVVVTEKVVEFNITLRVDSSLGSLNSDGDVILVTVNGVLEELPRKITILKNNYDFWGWYTAAGKEVIVGETVFTADTEITARIAPKNGVWVNFGKSTEKYVALTRNNGASGDDLKAEYWMGDGATVELVKDDELCWYIGGIQCTGVWITGQGVTGIETNTNSVKVTTPGPFKFYLKDYSNESKPIDWVCECAGPTLTEEGSEIPDGCDPIVIKIGSFAPITFYLQTSTGASVGSAEFSKYCIYTFGPEIFGNWGDSTTKGVCKSEIIVSGSIVPTGWIFRWGSGYSTQTANIENVIKAGGSYLVQLPAVNKEDAKVTVLNLNK